MTGFSLMTFLSTLSLRRATSRQVTSSACRSVFLSTLSLRRATIVAVCNRLCFCISIHALLAESDLSLSFGHIFPYNISIHALLAESDTLQFMRARTVAISIHALLAESDSRPKTLKSRRIVFLSTLSLRRATVSQSAAIGKWDISIHALLAESDQGKSPPRRAEVYFYPRSPCGERPLSQFVTDFVFVFLSTLSLRRATFL